MIRLRSFIRQEGGATSIEYALIAAFIGLVLISAAAIVGTELQGTFETVETGLAKRTAI